MGLDISHGAFSGAYSSFNRFRQAVAKSMGGSYPPHDDQTLDQSMWYWGDGFSEATNPGLYVFLAHSDCDGEISPSDCKLIADELQVLLSEISEHGEGGGHIARDGGYQVVTEKFIEGCRLAADMGEPLVFQ